MLQLKKELLSADPGMTTMMEPTFSNASNVTEMSAEIMQQKSLIHYYYPAVVLKQYDLSNQ